MNNQIEQMQGVTDDHICSICFNIMLTPAKLKCNHEFCCFCIRSIMYAKQSEASCPLCRKVMTAPVINPAKEIQIISNLLVNQKEVTVFYGSAQTINHYDQNCTKSMPCYFLLKDDCISTDIIWSLGSVHNSYDGEVGRGKGKIRFDQKRDIQFVDFNFVYSNSPTEEWKGKLVQKQENVYQAQNLIYTWEGWGRSSSGDLVVSLKRITKLSQIKQ